MSEKDVKETKSEITRRKFFLFFGWFGILSSLAGSALGSVRFMFPNVLYEPPTTFKIGKPCRLSSKQCNLCAGPKALCCSWKGRY